ncbi:MAG: DUF2520 domain-containing protein, partial [Actinomycetota bacterium]
DGLMKDGRLSIGILGDSTEGIAVAGALQAAGHIVVGYSTKPGESMEQIQTALPFSKALSETELLQQSDLVILAIEAQELQLQVENLVEKDLLHAGQLLVHLAKEFDHEVLSAVMPLGVIPLALSPAMVFTGTSLDQARFKECYFAVSAPNVAIPIAQALVIEMGAEPIVVSGENRAAFAEAVAVAGNFSAMIVNQAIGLLEQAGVDSPASVLAPVVRSAVEQALAKGYKNLDPEDLLGDN